MSTVIEQPPKLADSVRYGLADAGIAELAAQYMPLTIKGIDDTKGLKVVHEARMIVKNHRVEIEKTRKALKADALEYGRVVDSEAKRLTALIEPIEDHLEAEENRVLAEKERIRKEKEEAKRAITQARVDAFMAVGQIIAFSVAESLTDAEYSEQLGAATAAKIEADRVAALEVERLAAEHREAARLQAEEDARRKAEAIALAAERAELDRLRQEQQAEANRLAAERQRIADEELAKQRAIQLESARAEAVERERKDAEARAIADAAAARVKAEVEEAERLRLEALKPDREKLLALADTLFNLERPTVSDVAKPALAKADKAILVAVTAIRQLAEQL